MTPREIPASVGQRLLWLLDEYQGRSGALNCPLVCRIDGPLDLVALQAALDCLVARHESLRTTFLRRVRRLRQVIHQPKTIPLKQFDMSDAPDPEAATQQLLVAELRTRIDPTHWPWRTTVWRLARETHVLCLNMHHLVTDTWSCRVLQRELATAYEQCQSGSAKLPPGGWQFCQFMAWQDRQIAGDGFVRHREYWRRQLTGATAPDLPLRPRQPNAMGPRNSVQAELDAGSVRRLKRIAIAHRTTLFAVTLSAYCAMLSRSTGQRDLAVATLFANRTRREVENTVGFLTNLVVLRTQLHGAATFADIVQRVRATTVEAMTHQDIPYHLVSPGAKTATSHRLDEVVFQMLAQPLDQKCRGGDVMFHGIVPDVPGRFDLELALMPRHDGMAVKLYYSEDRTDPPWARQFIAGYIRVAAAVAVQPHAPLEALIDVAPALRVDCKV